MKIYKNKTVLKRTKRWTGMIIRNFFPLIWRVLKLLVRLRKVRNPRIKESNLSNHYTTSNVRTIAIKRVSGAFLIKINELIIPIFKDGDYTIILPLKENSNNLKIVLVGCRNVRRKTVKASFQKFVDVTDIKEPIRRTIVFKPILKVFKPIKKSIQLQQRIVSLKKEVVNINLKPITISSKLVQVSTPKMYLKENDLHLDYENFKKNQAKL